MNVGGLRFKMGVISVSLPDPLVAAMDDAAAAQGLAGRSAFVRAALRGHLERTQEAATGHVHGSLTIAYPAGHEARVSEARHAFHDVVLSMMHTHCDPELCMDVLVVGGDAARVQALQATLDAMRVVERAALVTVG